LQAAILAQRRRAIVPLQHARVGARGERGDGFGLATQRVGAV
jgi:hypothetical protein